MTTQITVEENVWGVQNNLLTYVCLFEQKITKGEGSPAKVRRKTVCLFVVLVVFCCKVIVHFCYVNSSVIMKNAHLLAYYHSCSVLGGQMAV